MGERKKEKKHKRIGSIDVVKGITIFLVIVGHAAGNTDAPFYRVVLYAFHMPLFFMVSGMVLKPAEKYDLQHWKYFLSKNFLALMVPYFIWGAIYSQFSYRNLGWIAYGSWQALGKAGTLTSLWFLPALFGARVLMELVFMLFRKINANSRMLAAVVSVIAFAIGLLLPKLENGYPWCADVAVVALGFLAFGYAVQDLLKKFYTSVPKFVYWIAMIISMAMFVLGIYMQKDNLQLMLMCASTYGNIILFFWNAISGSAAALFLSMIISDSGKTSKVMGGVKKKISYVGTLTFGIFILHKPFLQEVCMGILGKFGITAFEFWPVLGASFVTLILCCYAIKVINRFVPQLMGRFPDLDGHSDFNK